MTGFAGGLGIAAVILWYVYLSRSIEEITDFFDVIDVDTNEAANAAMGGATASLAFLR